MGTITDPVVMIDRATGNSRGFGFVTYESTDSVDMIIAQYDDHRIEGKWVEVKRAIARDLMPPGSTPTPSDKGKGKGTSTGSSGGSNADSDSRPGDWVCAECRATVFASKDSCFKCGAPRPAVSHSGSGDDRPSSAPAGNGSSLGYDMSSMP